MEPICSLTSLARVRAVADYGADPLRTCVQDADGDLLAAGGRLLRRRYADRVHVPAVGKNQGSQILRQHATNCTRGQSQA